MIKTRHMAQVCREAMAAVNGSPRWDDLNDRQRRLSVHIINHILANPDATPAAVHNAWMGEMQHNEGWTTGPIIDETLKQHPNITPFAYLESRHNESYAVSIGIVRGLLAIANRYENCAPQCHPSTDSTPPLGIPALPQLQETEPTSFDVVPPVEPTVLTDGGLTLEEIAALTPTVPSDAQFQTPESGDVVESTDPARAE